MVEVVVALEVLGGLDEAKSPVGGGEGGGVLVGGGGGRGGAVGVGTVGKAVLRTQLGSLEARVIESRSASPEEMQLLNRLMPNPPQNLTTADVNAMLSQRTTQLYLDSWYPLWNSPTVAVGRSFWDLAMREANDTLALTWAWMAVVLALPLAGVLVLGVMRQSFSREKILIGHGVRVALYSGDAGVFVVGYAAVCALEMLKAIGWVNLPYLFLRTGLLPWLSVVVWGVWLFRFEAGVRQYLCVPRPWMVTGATAVIAGSIMVIAGSIWMILVYPAYSWRF